jgi:hypothetical protein
MAQVRRFNPRLKQTSCVVRAAPGKQPSCVTSSAPAAAEQLARVLADLAQVRRTIDELEHQVAMLARVAGATWEEIGESMVPPISRQAARSRLGEPKRRQR